MVATSLCSGKYDKAQWLCKHFVMVTTLHKHEDYNNITVEVTTTTQLQVSLTILKLCQLNHFVHGLH